MSLRHQLTHHVVKFAGDLVALGRAAFRPAVRRYRHARLMLQLPGVLAALDQAGLAYMIGGGLSYDAYRGRLTRPHEDLDICINASEVETLKQTLADQGFLFLEQNQDGLKFARPGFRLDAFVWHQDRSASEVFLEHAYHDQLLRVPEALLRPVPSTLRGIDFPVQPIWVLRLMPSIPLHPADRAYVETISFPQGYRPVSGTYRSQVPRPCVELKPGVLENH